MRVFFTKMGITNIRFKPAYNPYTEVGRLGVPGPPAILMHILILTPLIPRPHTALARDLRLPPAAEQVGRGREQWHVPPRDARAHGLPQGRARPRLGHQPRAADDDSVRAFLPQSP